MVRSFALHFLFLVSNFFCSHFLFYIPLDVIFVFLFAGRLQGVSYHRGPGAFSCFPLTGFGIWFFVIYGRHHCFYTFASTTYIFLLLPVNLLAWQARAGTFFYTFFFVHSYLLFVTRFGSFLLSSWKKNLGYGAGMGRFFVTSLMADRFPFFFSSSFSSMQALNLFWRERRRADFLLL